MNMQVTKREMHYYRLFAAKCREVGFQFHYSLTSGSFYDGKTNDKIKIWQVNFWYDGLTKEQCYERGALMNILDHDSVWLLSWKFLIKVLKEQESA